MRKPPYYDLPDLIRMIDEPNQSICRRICEENKALFETAPGSSHNHQAWKGGYLDHVREVMNYAVLFYRAEGSVGRLIPFSLSDALLCLFLHDIEKPWRFETMRGDGSRSRPHLRSKEQRAGFRETFIRNEGFVLTDAHWNAIRYAEGEGRDYRPDRRVSCELAGFVHAMDHYSARVRHDYPRTDDPWTAPNAAYADAEREVDATVTFRVYRPEDLDTLIELAWPDADLRELESYRAVRAWNTVIVAEKEGRLVGYVQYGDSSDDPGDYDLFGLAVDPSLSRSEAAVIRARLEREFEKKKGGC